MLVMFADNKTECRYSSLDDAVELSERNSSKMMSVGSCVAGSVFIASAVLTVFCFRDSLFGEEIPSSSRTVIKVIFITVDIFAGLATLMLCKKCITGRGTLREKICFCPERRKHVEGEEGAEPTGMRIPLGIE